jgi:hypothetical protein
MALLTVSSVNLELKISIFIIIGIIYTKLPGHLGNFGGKC